MKMNPGGRALALGALSLAMLLTACGGDDASDGARPGATDGGETAAATGACALLSLDEVSELFGQDAQIVPGPEGGAAASACFWEAAEEDGDFPMRHQLQLSVFDDGSPLDFSSMGDDPEPIDDLGDEAYVVPAGLLGTTAGYRSGNQTVTLSYAIIAGDQAPSSADQADEVVELLRMVSERSEGAG